uniref:non-specific serine/threonine protein kinase n=1 Tax=Syphacia muris TaxID=451379 RepID=A0A0N5AZ33_9BILA
MLYTKCFTPLYVPPEILNGEPYDKSCDMWSLGVLLYFLLSGNPPFYPEGSKHFLSRKISEANFEFVPEEWKDISDEAKQLVKRMLVIKPRARLTIDELMASKWVTWYDQVPETPLATSADNPHNTKKGMKRNHKKLNEVLEAMRIGNDDVLVKPMSEINNNLLERRRRIGDALHT